MDFGFILCVEDRGGAPSPYIVPVHSLQLGSHDDKEKCMSTHGFRDIGGTGLGFRSRGGRMISHPGGVDGGK